MIDATLAPKVGFISPFGTTACNVNHSNARGERLTPRLWRRPAWSKGGSSGPLPKLSVMSGGSGLQQGRGASARSDLVAPIARAGDSRPSRGVEGASSEPTRGASRRGTRLTRRGVARENGFRISYPSANAIILAHHLINGLLATKQGHDLLAKIFGAGNKIVKDAHDAFETIDLCEFIELSRH